MNAEWGENDNKQTNQRQYCRLASNESFSRECNTHVILTCLPLTIWLECHKTCRTWVVDIRTLHSIGFQKIFLGGQRGWKHSDFVPCVSFALLQQFGFQDKLNTNALLGTSNALRNARGSYLNYLCCISHFQTSLGTSNNATLQGQCICSNLDWRLATPPFTMCIAPIIMSIFFTWFHRNALRSAAAAAEASVTTAQS
jgi:hypothetical protein